ncbi:MAG TPA: hypothetical protein VH165_33985, partial [Kofleriaceae bacterium]|nr:hypothetical protein [Kofleriaceae bacterium]
MRAVPGGIFAGLAGLAGVTSLAACSVPDKQRAVADAGAGSDAAVDAAPVTGALATSIDEAPDPFSRISQPTFRFSSNDPGATFLCRIDTEVAQACRSPYVRTLADGPHSFSVRAVAASGTSDDTPAEVVWTIDTVAPDTALVSGPPSADNSVMAQFMFSSNEANVEFDCSLDNAGYLPCATGGLFGPVGDGTHTFAVRARDRAGNLDASPAVFAWTVDTSTPDTQIITGPPDASPSTTASFSFVSPDAGAGATFTCSLDGAAFAACTSPRMVTGLAEGSHTFAVRVRDAVGNVDPTPATQTWAVDLTPPTTTITAGPSGTQPVASTSITFTANEMTVTFACALDGAAYAACTSPAALTALAQGPHTFAVRATDAAGHVDPTPATASWSVDTVAPDV